VALIRQAGASATNSARQCLCASSSCIGLVRHKQCCLTLRSSRPAPAWHLARQALAVIIRLAGQAPHRRGRLSSNVRRLMHHALLIIALAVLSPYALAKPSVGAVSEPPNNTPSCRVYLASEQSTQGLLVLYWSSQTAHMQVDGHTLSLTPRELPCRSQCVSPGKSGYRVFQFSNGQTRATLRKRASCPRDAEVCGGLSEGPAQLVVHSSAGASQHRVRTEYCDL